MQYVDLKASRYLNFALNVFLVRNGRWRWDNDWLYWDDSKIKSLGCCTWHSSQNGVIAELRFFAIIINSGPSYCYLCNTNTSNDLYDVTVTFQQCFGNFLVLSVIPSCCPCLNHSWSTWIQSFKCQMGDTDTPNFLKTDCHNASIVLNNRIT